MPAATTTTFGRLAKATPNTLGSKRSQARAIFRQIEQLGFGPRQGHVLFDPFFGSGAIGLTGKLLGYRVVAGDTSPRAEAIADALLTNDHFQLEPADVARAFRADSTGWFIPPLSHLPWPENSLRLLAAMCKTADDFENSAKRALMRTLMVKTASHLSLYGQPRMTAHQRIRERRWDALTQGQVARILTPQTHPKQMAQRCATQLYGVAFPNGQDNEFRRVDVLDLLDGASGDVLYVDAPYPATEGYGRNYRGVDELLENRELALEESRFSEPDGWRHLADVFEAAANFPAIVLSLGGELAKVNADDLVGLASNAGRTVTIESVPYALLRSRRTAKSDGKREHLLIAVRGGK